MLRPFLSRASGSHVTVVNAHYNGTVGARANTEPWFIAHGSGTAPANCRINGNRCDGTADRSPSAPTNLAVTGRTTKTVSLSWTAAVPTDFPIGGYDVYAGMAEFRRQLDAAGPGVTAGNVNGEWQTATGAAPGQFQEEAGTRGYSNLIAMVPHCTVYHDTQSISTYCFTGNGGQWWTFDDAWSVQQKTTWLKSKGLLGAMVWEMSGDTSTGTLMTTLHNGL